MSFTIQSILHASFIVADINTSLRFYHELLGLSIDESRPDLGYPGAWLNVGDQQIHLMQLPNPDPTQGRPAHGGRDRHIALEVKNIDLFTRKLDENFIQYTRSKSGRSAIFLRDPDGNALEFVGM